MQECEWYWQIFDEAPYGTSFLFNSFEPWPILVTQQSPACTVLCRWCFCYTIWPNTNTLFRHNGVFTTALVMCYVHVRVYGCQCRAWSIQTMCCANCYILVWDVFVDFSRLYVFTVRLHVMQCTVLLSQFCLSVCLSDACIVTKLNDALRIFWYHTKLQLL